MRRRIQLLVMLFSLTFSIHLWAAPQAGVRARISADSGKSYVEVNNLILDFIFTGYGLYSPGDYPLLTELPLENGEKIRFSHLKQVTLSSERVYWKEYIEPSQRSKISSVDENGYRHWSDIEVNVQLVDWEGDSTNSRLKRPKNSDVMLRGETNRGEFELQIDQETLKKIHIIFRPNHVMQCSGDKSHLFPNSTYKFCPLCGKILVKITRENVKKNGSESLN